MHLFIIHLFKYAERLEIGVERTSFQKMLKNSFSSLFFSQQRKQNHPEEERLRRTRVEIESNKIMRACSFQNSRHYSRPLEAVSDQTTTPRLVSKTKSPLPFENQLLGQPSWRRTDPVLTTEHILRNRLEFVE